MLQSFGLVRSNTLKEIVYRRPSYYAMQNVYAIFDDDTRALGHETAKSGGRDLTCCRFSRLGHDWWLYWFSEAQPSSDLEFARIDIEIPWKTLHPVWVEMITGRVFAISDVEETEGGMLLRGVPMWDSPIAVASIDDVPLRPQAQSIRKDEK